MALNPGVKITVEKVTIPSDRKPVVTFKLTDDKGSPLDRTGKISPGAISVRFTLAYIHEVATGKLTEYISYTTRKQKTETQSSTDSGGTFKDLGNGRYSYTFKTVLPSGYDKTATHTLGGYATREIPEALGGAEYDGNVAFDFRPDGKTVTVKRRLVSTAACNKCHNPLALHGGHRREVGLCVTCHTEKSTDPATGKPAKFFDPDTKNTVDFKVMIHKIHRGKDLPSVKAGTKYRIIGYRQSVHDYSTVAFPRPITDCQACHTGAPQAEYHDTKPSIAACQACHDDLAITKSSTKHKGGQQVTSAACATCHTKAKIHSAHETAYDKTGAPSLDVTITAVKLLGSGTSRKPQIDFTVKDEKGFRDLKKNPVNRLIFGYNGPTSSKYSLFPMPRVTAQGSGATGTLTVVDASKGKHRYVYASAVDTSSWKGTYAFVAEARVVDSSNNRFPTDNKPFFVAITDTTAKPRKQVVEDTKCNACHGKLRMHGENRSGVDGCVMCHNPKATDAAQRPSSAGPPQSIYFPVLVHKIHTGEDLSGSFTVYGYGGSAHDFTEVRFPGKRQDCETCHKSGTQDDVVSTLICTTCHDSAATKAHASLNTTSGGVETCTVCHGSGKQFAVDKVHKTD